MKPRCCIPRNPYLYKQKNDKAVAAQTDDTDTGLSRDISRTYLRNFRFSVLVQNDFKTIVTVYRGETRYTKINKRNTRLSEIVRHDPKQLQGQNQKKNVQNCLGFGNDVTMDLDDQAII